MQVINRIHFREGTKNKKNHVIIEVLIILNIKSHKGTLCQIKLVMFK